MLKKLVKYGNSHALVLDKSIMALLELKDGDSVKLRIEGNSLIVRGEKSVNVKDSYLVEVDAIKDRAEAVSGKALPMVDFAMAKMEQTLDEHQNDPEKMQQLKDWGPGTANFKLIQDAYGEVMPKYAGEMKKLESPAFKEETEKLAQKYTRNEEATEYLQELSKLRNKFAPKLKEFDQEMAEKFKELGIPQDYPVW